MSGNELREAYLTFFEQKGHLCLPSASLIPENDPTLLMIGAGMAPFKPFFTGKMKPPRTRITTSQRCVRTGDIENVGHTARHQTYFEMLGNFSFGDYFKEDAISWAWEFLTEVVCLPKDKLWVTVYPKDEEAVSIWKKQAGLLHDHIVPLEDNFWEIGEGPCGPDSEIYIDLGEERGCGKKDCKVGCDCDRYLEIWNLVFTQFDRTSTGEYLPLKHKNIDTGCGLERLASVLQEKETNFETDLLFPIIEYEEGLAGVKYGEDKKKDVSLKVIADHARSMSIMIMDGVLPSNEGRGYILRRILRRAVRHGKLLGIQESFLTGAVEKVVDIYKDARDFQALVAKKDYIKRVIALEEERFQKTLSSGIELLTAQVEEMREKKETVLQGEIAFKLYDTFGFPLELTEEMLHEEGFSLDKEAFQLAMDEQKKRARSARKANKGLSIPDLRSLDTSTLSHDLLSTKAKVFCLFQSGKIVEEVTDGDDVGVILSVTPFYAEGGGQVGDVGTLKSAFGVLEVHTAKKMPDGTIYHVASVKEGFLRTGDEVTIEIDRVEHLSSARNHTATHLLHAALRRVLGEHVSQAGSLVEPSRLRFDFSHFSPLTTSELEAVEKMVNEVIFSAVDVVFREMPIAEAKKLGAMALFGEKYGDIVRVVEVPGFSIELCGGSHIDNVGKISMFKIISETGIAAGVRRIEAITGRAFANYAREQDSIVKKVTTLLKCQADDIHLQVENLLRDKKSLEEELLKVKISEEKNISKELLEKKEMVDDVAVIIQKVQADGVEALRDLADMLISHFDKGVVALASTTDEAKVNIVVKATKSAVASGMHAGIIVKEMAKIVGGGGGGRADMAQAGGKMAENIDMALKKGIEVIQGILKA